MIQLLLSLAVWAGAAGPTPCVSAGKYKAPGPEPATLEDLASCQRRALDDAAAAYAKGHDGQLPSDELTARWQARQSAESARFLKKHPDIAKAAAPGLGEINLSAEDNIPVPPNPDEARAALTEPRGDGKTLSEKNAKQVQDYLGQKQGGTSPDMTQLLKELQSDGKPSDASLEKLRKTVEDAGEKAPPLEPDLHPERER